MAADILVHKATHVPVGDDQTQHLELCRDIAQKFNHDYGVEYFPIIEPIVMGAATRVMSLRDGTRKMSKSEPSAASRIDLTDGPEEIARKIRRAKTDPEPLPEALSGLEGRPEAANLLGIYGAFADITLEDAVVRFAGASFSTFKGALSDLAIDKLGPVGDEMRRLMADPGHIDAVLRDGAERAEAIAGAHLREIQDIVGLLRP
jgi:tryptophanyl-tRNA synthetase